MELFSILVASGHAHALRVTYHGADVQQGLEATVCPLILWHALNTALLNLELASQALCASVHAISIFEAFPRDSAIFSDVCRSLLIPRVPYANLAGVLLEIEDFVAHGEPEMRASPRICLAVGAPLPLWKVY